MYKVVEIIDGLFTTLCSTDDIMIAQAIADKGSHTFVRSENGYLYTPKGFNPNAAGRSFKF